jgi:hypothetical protein
MQDLQEFRATERPAKARSRLAPHKDTIFALLQDGYSYSQIVKYLGTHQIKITKQSLGEWIRRQERTPAKASLTPKVNSVAATPSEPHVTPKTEDQAVTPLSSTSAFNPRAIDQMRSVSVDLDQYSRQRRKTK